MLKKHIVIVGGGWAGISLVRSLSSIDSRRARITLVSNEPNFRYSAALYRVATGHKEKEAIIPIKELIAGIRNTNFIKATATDIDPQAKTIKLHGNKILHYDYAVLAMGSVTSYFNIPGLEENSYGIKSQKDLRTFRTHIHEQLQNKHTPDKNYVVVGAGPTGVELSAAMASYMKLVLKRHGIKKNKINIELIEAAPRVLPNSNPKASKKVHQRLKKLGVKVLLNAKVEHETTRSLVVNGRSIPTHTVIWTAGVANSPFFHRHAKIFKQNQRNKVLVDDHLRSHNNVYVIGDNAVTPYSGLGLTAVHNAKYVAKDLERRLEGERKTKPYKPLKPATVIPVGKNWAVLEYRKIVITGFIGHIVRNLADFIAYKDVGGTIKALNLTMHSQDLEESCYLCKTRLDTVVE